jgi:hypothetical protein
MNIYQTQQDDIEELDISNKKLTEFVLSIFYKLVKFNCSNNQLIMIHILPSTLKLLNCYISKSSYYPYY